MAGYNEVAVGLSIEPGEFKAVGLRRGNDSFEVLWHRTAKRDETTWADFCSDLGEAGQCILGFDSRSIAFYNITIPPVKGVQAEAVIRMQAEALLPLPIEQMELAWRCDRRSNDEQAVTIVAGRMAVLKNFVEFATVAQPRQVLLNCEAVVKAWQKFYKASAKAVVINVKPTAVELCLVEDGQLKRAGELDFDIAAGDTNMGMFEQDLQGMLKAFSLDTSSQVPIHVIAREKTVAAGLAERLCGLGYQARSVEAIEDAAEILGEYIEPVGLALLGLESQGEPLELFRQLYRPQQQQEQTEDIGLLKRLAAIVAVLCVIFVLSWYAADKMKQRQFEKYLSADSAKETALLIEKQTLRKHVAANRPDILGLLKKINAARSDEVLLDSISFKKGQKVTLAGHTKDNSGVLKFHESLAKQKVLSEVRILNQTTDKKKKQTSFTITFHYKDFTKKKKKI